MALITTASVTTHTTNGNYAQYFKRVSAFYAMLFFMSCFYVTITRQIDTKIYALV